MDCLMSTMSTQHRALQVATVAGMFIAACAAGWMLGRRTPIDPDLAALQRVSDLLTDAGIRHCLDRADRFIVTNIDTSRYRNVAGVRLLLIEIRTDRGGDSILVSAPFAWRCTPGEGDVTRANGLCHALSWDTLVNARVNQDDGEIRPAIAFPLSGAHLSSRQLAACIQHLQAFVEKYDERIRDAIECMSTPRAMRYGGVHRLGSPGLWVAERTGV
jgi:hypothetical protein